MTHFAVARVASGKGLRGRAAKERKRAIGEHIAEARAARAARANFHRNQGTTP